MVANSAAIRQLLAKGLSMKASIKVARYKRPMRIRPAMAAMRFLFIRQAVLSAEDKVFGYQSNIKIIQNNEAVPKRVWQGK